MFADLPPSSSVTFFTVPDASCMMRRPTSVEPVNATLSTSGVLRELLTGAATRARDEVHDAGRDAGLFTRLHHLDRR